MEKAYDKVWKDGLRLKLQKSSVTGCMYLTNGKALVQVDGTYSHKKTTRGVPQGGILSPTLFLVFRLRRRSIWFCGAQRNILQLQTIDCSRRWTSWKVGQNGGLSKSTLGRLLIPSSAFQQKNRRPTCIYQWSDSASPTYLGSLSTDGRHGINKPRIQKPEPRCDLPSWRSWQSQHGAQIL